MGGGGGGSRDPPPASLKLGVRRPGTQDKASGRPTNIHRTSLQKYHRLPPPRVAHRETSCSGHLRTWRWAVDRAESPGEEKRTAGRGGHTPFPRDVSAAAAAAAAADRPALRGHPDRSTKTWVITVSFKAIRNRNHLIMNSV